MKNQLKAGEWIRTQDVYVLRPAWEADENESQTAFPTVIARK